MGPAYKLPPKPHAQLASFNEGESSRAELDALRAQCILPTGFDGQRSILAPTVFVFTIEWDMILRNNYTISSDHEIRPLWVPYQPSEKEPLGSKVARIAFK